MVPVFRTERPGISIQDAIIPLKLSHTPPEKGLQNADNVNLVLSVKRVDS